MDTALWGLLGYVLYTWATKRQEQQAEINRWREDIPVNGTDFQGTIWERLDGVDLLNAKWADQNLDNSNSADPGRIGQANIGLAPSWNGNL